MNIFRLFRQLFKPNIAKLEQRRDIPGLIKELDHPSKPIRLSVIAALEQTGAAAIEPLIVALKNEDQNICIRKGVVEILGTIGGVRAVVPLIAISKYEHSNMRLPVVSIRKRAVEVLGQIGDVRAITPLIAAFKDIDLSVRQAATESLVKIGAAAVKSLIAALKDENENVREGAVWALGDIGDNRAAGPLFAILKSHNESYNVFRAAASVLKYTDLKDNLSISQPQAKREQLQRQLDELIYRYAPDSYGG